MKESELIPIGCVKIDALRKLAKAMVKMHIWHEKHKGKVQDEPCLRLIQGSRSGLITALVQTGNLTLKLVYRHEEWVILGDALSV